jgi:hypothetical protein
MDLGIQEFSDLDSYQLSLEQKTQEILYNAL